MIPLRQRLLGGGQAVGIFVQAPHPVVAEVLGGLGPDLVCLDQEHAPMGPEAIHALVGGAMLAGLPAIVRVAAGTAHHVAAALDAGAVGVLVPRVESGAEAADVVRFARYPPVGARGVGPARATGYGRRIGDAVARAGDETLVGVQVETRRGVERLDEILAVEGVDLVFVGPGDLAASLGLDGGLADARLRPVVEEILDRIAAAGRASGIFAAEPAAGAEWLARGAGLVLLGSDLGFLATGVEQAWQLLNELRASA